MLSNKLLPRLGLTSDLYRLSLNAPRKAPVAMKQLLSDLTKELSPTDFVIALDASSVVLMVQGPYSDYTLRKRLVQKFPLLIRDVVKIELEKLPLHLGGQPPQASLEVRDFQPVPESLLTCLHIHLQTILGTDVPGTWWVATDGKWRSLSKAADGSLNKILSNLQWRSNHSVFITERSFVPQKNEVSGEKRRFWILRPTGVVIAIFEVDELVSGLQSALEQLSKRILMTELTRSFSPGRVLSPTEYFAMKRIVELLGCKFKFEVRHGTRRFDSPGEVVVAESMSGYGRKFQLSVMLSDRIQDETKAMLQEDATNVRHAS